MNNISDSRELNKRANPLRLKTALIMTPPPSVKYVLGWVELVGGFRFDKYSHRGLKQARPL